MPAMLTLKLVQPIAAVSLADRPQGAPPTPGAKRNSPDPPPAGQESESRQAQLAQLCHTINSIASNLDKLHQETLARHHTEIARLAVEIARKILMYKAGQGDYDIQAIIEEALKRAPTRQNVVIRLNPEDLAQCQRWQQENPEGPFAGLELTADWSIGRGECLVETPKGIVKSFIEEHLERISEALQKAQ
jgi:flagellar assembly protein FliH